VGQGAEVLLSPTVGFWFRTPEYFNTTNLIACFRAVETRRWVGRVASLSTSAYIDALGCVRSPQPFNTRVVNVMTVPLLSGQTFYTKFGDVFSWLCALVSAALIALAWLGARVRNPSERKPPAKG
jgi:apolipoprotein N-acyltransferase